MTVDGQARQRVSADPQTPVPPAVQLRSRRNPKWIALGVVAICLGAIASFFLYSQLSQSHEVVAMRETVHRGSTITAQDLGEVRVGETGGIATLPATQLDSLIGKVAVYDLVQGSLLPANSTSSSLPPDHGKSIIGIRVDTGRAPSGFLAAGSPVRLVVLPPDAASGDASGSVSGGTGSGSAGPSGGGTAGQGGTNNQTNEVTSVAVLTADVINSSTVDDGVFLNVELDSTSAAEAASFAAQDRVVVVRDSEH